MRDCSIDTEILKYGTLTATAVAVPSLLWCAGLTAVVATAAASVAVPVVEQWGKTTWNHKPIPVIVRWLL